MMKTKKHRERVYGKNAYKLLVLADPIISQLLEEYSEIVITKRKTDNALIVSGKTYQEPDKNDVFVGPILPIKKTRVVW